MNTCSKTLTYLVSQSTQRWHEKIILAHLIQVECSVKSMVCFKKQSGNIFCGGTLYKMGCSVLVVCCYRCEYLLPWSPGGCQDREQVVMTT